MKRTEELYHQNQINDIEAAIWGGPFSQPPKLTNMKFTPIKSAKLPFDTTLFVKDDNGQFHSAKLIKEEVTSSGTLKTFELARFGSELKIDMPTKTIQPGDLLSVTPIYVTNIASVAVPK